ncbi:MAG TPA: hypothetical protein PLE30_04730 [Candidatus Kapabacteria bacterium]|nr:hypothetical protein [Candidatus Kapabacteria bacterium]
MQNYDALYNQLINKIRSTRRKENLLLFLNGILISLGIGLSVLLVCVLLESILYSDTTLRTIFAGLSFVSFVVSFGVFAFPSLVRLFNIKNNPTINDIALRIGKFYPDMNDNLGNALQLIPISKKSNGMSSNLALAAFEEYYNQSYQKDFDVIIDKNDFKKKIIFFLIPSFLLLIGTTAFKSTIGESLNRIMHFNQSFLPPAPFSLEITPVQAELARDSRFRIEIIVKGTRPSQIWLSTKEQNQDKFDSFEIKANLDGKYIYEIPSIKNTMEFFAYSEWFDEKISTQTAKVTVIEKPLIKSISGRLVYPSYSELSPKFIDEQNADISALKGSKATFELLTNKNIEKASIVFIEKDIQVDTNKTQQDTLRIPLNINNNKISGELIVRQTGIYYFELIDKDAYTNENPINYTIIAQNDNYPEISLIEPTSDVEINSNGLLSIKAKINDDYGFSNLKLYYRLTESPYASPDEKYSSFDIIINKKELSQDIPYIWDLNKIGIMPDDKYEFYLAITDNDIISGPKVSKTQSISVKLPSLREVQKEADMAQEKVHQDLEKILKEALDVKKDIDELNREMLKEKNLKKEADWQDKKKAQDIAKKQEELKEKLSDVQQKLEETTKNLQENNLMSQETLEKYMELQKLMKQVDTPELRAMQDKMKDALKNMNQEDLKKAMENFKFNEEQFRQNIERTMQLLKRMQAEQKVDGLKNRAEQLAKQQENLAEQTKKSDANNKENQNNLAKQQDKLQNELNSLEKDMKDLDKLLDDLKDQKQIKEEFEQAKDALKSPETNQEMQNSQNSMKQGDNKKSEKSQKKASQNLNNFAQKMGQMKESMRKQSNEESAQKMQKAISDLLELSKKQELIKNQTQSSDYNSTSLPQYAQNQAQTFESLMNVAKAMNELSKKSMAVTPQMGQEMANALKQMRESIDNMADRNTRGASNSQIQAMSSMNKMVSQMQEMMDALKQQNQGSCNNPGGSGSGEGEGNPQNSGNGMSFSQKMQQIASEQQAVNQAMQKMMQGGGQQGQGGKEQLQKQAEQGRLADKQSTAQKSLEELAKEQKQFGGDKKKIDELQKIAQEMKEVMSDIKSKGNSPESLKKQERILSRLLDLQKSENERDFEKKREGNTANDIFAPSPAGLNLNNTDNEKVFKDLLRNNQQGYSKDYENLIKNYFNNLRKN